jgi:hypothetical protein
MQARTTLLMTACALAFARPFAAVAERAAPRGPSARCEAIASVTWLVSRTAQQSSPRDPSLPLRSESRVSMSTHSKADLDGDGALDTLVPEPSPTDCNNEYSFGVYLTRGRCGVRVGSIRGAPQIARIAGATRTRGMPELVTVIERAEQRDPRVPAERVSETITYQFDGAAYRERGRSVTRAVCHHCAQVRCRNTRIQAPPP